MQGVTRNPLADPGILGVNMPARRWRSSSDSPGSASASATSIVWVAIAGAAVTAVFVYTVGSLGRGGATPLKLALAGAATSAALASFVIAVVLPRGDIAGNIRSWQIGGVGGAPSRASGRCCPSSVVGFVVSLLSAAA